MMLEPPFSPRSSSCATNLADVGVLRHFTRNRKGCPWTEGTEEKCGCPQAPPPVQGLPSPPRKEQPGWHRQCHPTLAAEDGKSRGTARARNV